MFSGIKAVEEQQNGTDLRSGDRCKAGRVCPSPRRGRAGEEARRQGGRIGPLGLLSLQNRVDTRHKSYGRGTNALATFKETNIMQAQQALETVAAQNARSEEHTSELQSRLHLV